MPTLSCISELPQEIVALIFETASNSDIDLLQCMFVCRSWYLIAKTAFYKNITITEKTNIPLFIQCLKNHKVGHLIFNLTVSDVSKRHKSPPLRDPYDSNILLLRCQNIKKIKMINMNPYYMLRSIENSYLPKLEQIDVCWKTCSASEAVKKHFCGAIHKHKKTIKYIDMPDYKSRIRFVMMDDFVMTTLEDEFLQNFDNLAL